MSRLWRPRHPPTRRLHLSCHELPLCCQKGLVFPFHCRMRPQADACRALVALAYLDGGMAGPQAMLQPVVADTLRNHPQQQRLQVRKAATALCLKPSEREYSTVLTYDGRGTRIRECAAACWVRCNSQCAAVSLLLGWLRIVGHVLRDLLRGSVLG